MKRFHIRIRAELAAVMFPSFFGGGGEEGRGGGVNIRNEKSEKATLIAAKAEQLFELYKRVF